MLSVHTVPKYVSSTALSIWDAKLRCDVTHIGPSSADSATLLKSAVAQGLSFIFWQVQTF